MSIMTEASVDEVAEFFETAAEDGGLGSSSSESMSMNGTETRTMVFKGGGKSLTVNITSSGGDGARLVQVAYTEEK